VERRLVVASAADDHHRMEAARVGVRRVDPVWQTFKMPAVIDERSRFEPEPPQRVERRTGRHISDYLHGAIDPELRQRNVEHGVSYLQEVDFDAIAVTGFSGISMGAILADRLGKALLFVRKGRDAEEAHSCHDVEGPLDWAPKLARYVVVDDFICSGDTVRRVRKLIGGRAEFAGVYFWRDRYFLDVDEAQERGLIPERARVPARSKKACWE
jgi:adenine/guanine phosphoribosyltransferase-like PRPP-binding protein